MRTKPCRDCQREITVVRRAVGEGFDVLDAAKVPVTMRDAGDRVVVGGFAWTIARLVRQVAAEKEISKPHAVLLVHDDFSWHHRHSCPEAAA